LIRFLIDMGLPRRAAEDLRRDGWDVAHVGELGMAQAPDQEILAFAEKGRFTIVTLDGDFAKLLALGEKRVPSLIHLRLPDLDREATVQLLKRVVPLVLDDLGKGCIASVGPLGVRIRALPLFKE
jgi:predicted nuclease of predicted toxin-antitoxin system